MKTMILALAFIFTSLAHAEEKPLKLTCTGWSERISLEQYYGPRGELHDNYNGASLACNYDGLNRLVDNGQPMTCVGIWNHAYGLGNHRIEEIVRIEFVRNQAGKISASYVRNYDQRLGVEQDTVIMNCVVE